MRKERQMKLKENVTYLLNVAPGWLIKATVVKCVPPEAYGESGYYEVKDYAYLDFSADPFTKALSAGKEGKPAGLNACTGLNKHEVKGDAIHGIMDSVVLQWFVLDG